MGKARIVQFALSKKSAKAQDLLKRALNMREGGAAYSKPDRFARARFLGRKTYRSRAAFKLIDLEQRFGLCDGKKRILDLGAAPGSWSQVAAEVAPEASILAVDKKILKPFDEPRICVLQCDLEKTDEAETLPARVEKTLGGKAEIVLCDLAPNTVGLARIDNTRFAMAINAILPIVEGILEEGGDWLLKMRHSAEEQQLWGKLKERFTYLRAVRSVASRRGANEIYWIARKFRGANDKKCDPNTLPSILPDALPSGNSEK